ncbi:ArnT family glycosyltransferase [Planctomycetota bacterium]
MNAFSVSSIIKKHKVLVWLSCIVLFGFIIRVSHIRNAEINRKVPQPDALQYVNYGYNLAHFNTFSSESGTDNPTPDSYRSPGYPFIIASVMKLFPPNRWHKTVLYIHVIVSTLTVILTFYIGCFFMPKWASLLAAGLTAFSPHLISLTFYMLTETLFAFMLCAAFLAFFSAMRTGKTWLYILSALLFGYSYLVNEVIVFFPLTAAVLLCIEKWNAAGENRKSLIKQVILFTLLFLIFPVTWTIRNTVSIPEEGKTGKSRALATLTHGTYPGFIFKNPANKYYAYRDDPEQPAYHESFSSFIRIFWKRFSRRPFRYISWYLFEKPYYLWSWNILQGQGDVYIYYVSKSVYTESPPASFTKYIMRFLHPLLVLIAMCGTGMFTWNTVQKKEMLESGKPYMLFICLIYSTAIYSLFACWPRYSIPFRPELYICAVWSSILLWNMIKKRYFTEQAEEKNKIATPTSSGAGAFGREDRGG